jgi:hypothetical protein
MKQTLAQELDRGIIVRTSWARVRWASPCFFRLKPNGKLRKIIDCFFLNKHLRTVAFKMEDSRLLFHTLFPRQFATRLDFSDAFHQIPVDPVFSLFLAFSYGSAYYRYVGMPFGVNQAPRTFSAIMHVCIVAIRRLWDISAIFYLDDLLFLHASYDYLKQATL